MSRPDHSFAHIPCASTRGVTVPSLGLEGSLKRGRWDTEIASLVRQHSSHAFLPSRGALVLLRTVCVPVAVKRCVEQVAKSVCQGTLLLVKLPRGCPLHSGLNAWCPGYASSHLDWCQPPMSTARGWALLPQQPPFSYHPLSLLGATVGPAVGTSGPEHACAAVALVLRSICCLLLTTPAVPQFLMPTSVFVCLKGFCLQKY